MTLPEIVSKKRILKAKLFDVHEIVLKLPSGTKKIHQTATRPPTVSVFPITEDGHICLVSQYRYILGGVHLEAMAGFVDEGEEPIEAAKRELKEELGITAKVWKKLTRIELSASVFKAENHIFIAKNLEFGEANPEEGEIISMVKLPIDEAVKEVMKGKINHSASIIGILMIDKLNQEGKL